MDNHQGFVLITLNQISYPASYIMHSTQTTKPHWI